MLLSPLGLAYAQEKQATLAEAKARFERADRRLNDTWAAAKKSFQPEMFAEIEKVQRQWAKWRDDQARREAGFPDMPQARRDPSFFVEAAKITDQRADFCVE